MKLEIKNISKSFGETKVLHGISFEVEQGRAMGFLGRNGAGKSTTIRALMGIFHEDGGEFLIDGKKFKPRNYKIGFLPEERGMYSDSKILEQLLYFGVLRGGSKKETKKSAMELLERVDLLEYKDAKLKTLSKGNQQKVQIVQSLLNNPDIVILDEPFSGLDPVNSQILKDIIKDIVAQDKLLIFSSHQMNYVEEFCQDITLIHKGNIVLSENLPKLKSSLGEGRFLLKALNYSNEELLCYLEEKFPQLTLELSGQGVLLKDKLETKSNDILKSIVYSNVEVDRFSAYEPTLNDIFIKYVGDEK